ncbi:hypothetical protein GCM10010038_20010 [Glutamicibacter protophormiae]|nr:hypothetical protein GCM10010038_20010 [Glutamicibacter protophormiae]
MSIIVAVKYLSFAHVIEYPPCHGQFGGAGFNVGKARKTPNLEDYDVEWSEFCRRAAFDS